MTSGGSAMLSEPSSSASALATLLTPDAPRLADYKVGILPLDVTPSAQLLKISLTSDSEQAEPGAEVPAGGLDCRIDCIAFIEGKEVYTDFIARHTLA